MNSRLVILAATVSFLHSAAFGQTINTPIPILNLTPGWNLVGNSSNKPIDVPALFGSYATSVDTVWHWNSATSGWDFYTPLTSTNSVQYATSKGYGPLAFIPVSDGFWVNVSAATGMQLPLPYNTNPIVGTWYGSVPGNPSLQMALTFLANGTYLLADNGNTTAADPTGQPGIEVGTYTFNPTTGAFSSQCPAIDTNGQWGLSHNKQGGVSGCSGTGGTVTIQGTTATFATTNGNTWPFTRVAP